MYLRRGHGNWVVGDQFWDRERDLTVLAGRIDGGAHVLLAAQRRMGKTSLMHEVSRHLEDRYICLFVDLQGCSCSAEAVVELSLAIKPVKDLWDKSKELFGNVVGKLREAIDTIQLKDLAVTLRAGLTAGDWAVKADALFEILAESKKPVVLLMDEVPVMVNRMLKGDDFVITPERRREVDEFMSWLRKNSIRHKGKVRMVISGSIGFEPVLRQAGLSATLNTFEVLDLKPWDEPTAVGCLEALADGAGLVFEEGAAEAMTRHLACCIPHHVQMFFTYVHDHCVKRGDSAISLLDVDEVYNTEMLGIRGHAELAHYEERLKMVLGPEVLPFALDMVTEAAVTGYLGREALAAFRKNYSSLVGDVLKVQDEVLRVLEHDGYVKPDEKGYVFVSNLLRDWWKKHYAFFYTPIIERGL